MNPQGNAFDIGGLAAPESGPESGMEVGGDELAKLAEALIPYLLPMLIQAMGEGQEPTTPIM